MTRHASISRPVAVAVSILAAVVGLLLLTASMAGAGTGTDPRIESAAVLADLPIHDPQVGDGVTKTVYVNNSAAGSISVTFEISGTPALTLTAGAAFDDPGSIYTSSSVAPAVFTLTYAVSTTHTAQPAVAYTAINTHGLRATIAISYVPDSAPPYTGSVSIDGGAATTAQSEVTLTLSAADAGSGMAHVCVSNTLTCTAWQPYTTTKLWTLASGAGERAVYVRYRDRVGNTSGVYSDTIEVDQAFVYLPLVMKGWKSWYGIDVYEPNDMPDDAFGPLVSGLNYDAYIWDGTDTNDYYAITPTTGSQVSVVLQNIPAGTDYDLYVYIYDGAQYHQVTESLNEGNQSESLAFTPVAGTKYYIRVYPAAGSDDQNPYRLRATFN